jgi:glycosyltransferase involved in cell wall biosynthesis
VSPDPATSYAAVTPARDEEENLARLGAAMVAQTHTPASWVIVENGSSDGTLAVAQELARAHPWVRVLQTEASAAYDRTSPYMRAFHAGVQALDGAGDIVVKLDADVSVEPEFFAEIVAAFDADPQLGITSGILLEQDASGCWREREILGHHCWGPTRAYRRSCLEVVLPLDDGISYAQIDLTKAQLAGFRTGALQHLPFRHHRPEGGREGAWRQWHHQGLAAHHVGYRPSYLLARCAFRLPEDRAALALVAGYAHGVVGRQPRYADRRVVAAIRDEQRLRRVVATVRGRSPRESRS